MTNLVRSACLTNFADVAARCSLGALALLNEVGLPARALEDPDLKVPALAVGRLLELAAARGGEPAFGLRMAESRRLSNLGYLGMLVRDEPTLRGALEALMQNIHLHTDALALRLEQVGELVSLHEELVIEDGESPRQLLELVVASTLGALRILMGDRWRPRLVCFSHRAPRSDLMHRRIFGKAVEFEHPFNGIVFSAADLDAVNPGADPGMVRYARALLEPVLGAQAQLSDRIRQLAVLLLPRRSWVLTGVLSRVASRLKVRRSVSSSITCDESCCSATLKTARTHWLISPRFSDSPRRALSHVGTVNSLESRHAAAYRDQVGTV